MARYSATVAEHSQSPQNFYVMESADAVGVNGLPGQGRFFAIYLKFDVDRIDAAAFQCHGCGATIACGSMLTEIIIGLSCEECRDVSSGRLLEALDGLPADKRHCSHSAIQAMCQALDQWKDDRANTS